MIFSLTLAAMIGAITTFAISDNEEGIRPATCCNGDGPGCSCFQDSGSWNPSGTWIQDVAVATLGTRESCGDNAGKPYYQMRLGVSDIDLANDISCLLEIIGDFFGREAWCSETISYWHLKKGIPYDSGFRNSTWLLDWQLVNTNAIRAFYETEEQLSGGRGRWIDYGDTDFLDYDDFRLGENVPVPGAYVLIRQYVQTGPHQGVFIGCSHSMMVDSMFVYREYPPLKISRVRITLLEGNSGAAGEGRVRNTREIEDILQATPAGTSFVNYCGEDTVRKIVGFGVDLDEYGEPIYDSGRIRWIYSSYEAPEIDPWPDIDDLAWDMSFASLIPQLVNYAETLGETGPRVFPSSEHIEMPDYPDLQIPDGMGVRWVFPFDLDRYEPDGVHVEIDLLEEHPLLVTGIVLGWDSLYLPHGYSVRWARADGRYQDATVPVLAGIPPPDEPGVIPIPIMFQDPGARTRHIQLTFPPGTFSKTASLEEIRFLYDWGADDDASYNPPVGACCLLDGRCVTTTARVCDTLGGTYHGDDVLCLGDANGDEIDDRCTVTDLLKCDMDGNGIVDIVDVLAVVNHILDIRPLGEDALARADCNGDGRVNVVDVLGCVNVILGISECEP